MMMEELARIRGLLAKNSGAGKATGAIERTAQITLEMIGGRLRFVVSHPCGKERRMDGAP